MICLNVIGSGTYAMNTFEVFWKYYFCAQKQIIKNRCASRTVGASLWHDILIFFFLFTNKHTVADVK